MRAARTDANHVTIAKAFRKLGFTVLSLHRVGQGCPDLLCSRHGHSFLVEVKTPTGREKDTQERFRQNWKGCLYMVRSEADVEAVVRTTARYEVRA